MPAAVPVVACTINQQCQSLLAPSTSWGMQAGGQKQEDPGKPWPSHSFLSATAAPSQTLEAAAPGWCGDYPAPKHRVCSIFLCSQGCKLRPLPIGNFLVLTMELAYRSPCARHAQTRNVQRTPGTLWQPVRSHATPRNGRVDRLAGVGPLAHSHNVRQVKGVRVPMLGSGRPYQRARLPCCLRLKGPRLWGTACSTVQQKVAAAAAKMPESTTLKTVARERYQRWQAGLPQRLLSSCHFSSESMPRGGQPDARLLQLRLSLIHI